MAPVPSPGQVVRLDWNYSTDGALATNVMYFSYSGAGALSPAELTAFATSSAMTSDLEAPYVGAAPGYTQGQPSKFQDLISDMGAVVEHTDSWSGTNTGSALPTSASVLVSDEILRHYRGGHPRTYMMVGLASDIAIANNTQWQTTFLANIQAGWTAFMADFPLSIGSRTYNPVNVSFWETVAGVKTLRATPLVDLITSKIVRTRVCSQRRRLGKVGG